LYEKPWLDKPSPQRKDDPLPRRKDDPPKNTPAFYKNDDPQPF